MGIFCFGNLSSYSNELTSREKPRTQTEVVTLGLEKETNKWNVNNLVISWIGRLREKEKSKPAPRFLMQVGKLENVCAYVCIS